MLSVLHKLQLVYSISDKQVDFFKDARAEFTVSEWIDVVLGAIDYNAQGYKDENEKLAMLARLLPFVEKGYMERGRFNVDGYDGESFAGVVLLGNISIENMNC